jgi:hypothetical protein
MTLEFKSEEVQELVEKFNLDYNKENKREKRFGNGKY